MGKGKMDDAAAERIKKARGEKVRGPRGQDSFWQRRVVLTCLALQDEFARRAAIAARANKEGQVQGGGQGGNGDAKQGGGAASKK